jgi:Rieske Fe-S protein
MKWFRRRLSSRPLWEEEVPIQAADERYVSRRQLTKFMVLTSFGMFVGHVWIAVRRWFRRDEGPFAPAAIARLDELPVGGVKLFTYPEPKDHCILLRLDEQNYVAYSQKCTHLSCAVIYQHDRGHLECPCHEGYFSAWDGRVLQGPPPRPLPRITLAIQGDQLVATGVDLQSGVAG